MNADADLNASATASCPSQSPRAAAVSARLIQKRRVMSRSSGFVFFYCHRARLEGHAADRTISRLRSHDFGMHGAGVFGLCSRGARATRDRTPFHTWDKARDRSGAPRDTSDTRRRACLFRGSPSERGERRSASSISAHPLEHPERQVPIPSAWEEMPKSFRDSPGISGGNRHSRRNTLCRCVKS